MKKLFFLLITLGLSAAAMALPGCSGSVRNLKIELGEEYSDGKSTTRTVAVPDYQTIHAARAVEVFITDRTSQRILIEAPEKLLPHVVVKEQGGTLLVSIDSKIKRIGNAKVKVYLPYNGKTSALKASSAAKIICQTALGAEKINITASSAAEIEAAAKTEVCTISASSAARIKAALRTGACVVDASSAAKVVLSGSADQCKADISSAASFIAPEFEVAGYEIDASSGANAGIRCTKELRAEASSGASIEYTGDCTTDLSRSSGGSIQQTR